MHYLYLFLLLFFYSLAGAVGQQNVDRVCLSRDLSAPIEEVKRIKESSKTRPKVATLEFYSKIYSSENQLVALALFSEIKSLTKDYLKEILQKRRDPRDEVWNQLLLERLERSQLKLNQVDVQADFNISTDYRGMVQVAGLMELAQRQPNALFLLLAHELGHVLGPTHIFIKDIEQHKSRPVILPYDKNYPFNQLVEETSAKNRGHDYNCLASRIDEMKQSHPALRIQGEIFEKTLADIRDLAPMISMDYFAFGKSSCPPSQQEEAFADLFAAKILEMRLKKKETKSQESFASFFSFFCAEFLEEKKSGHVEPDPHPSAKSRLIELFKSSPSRQ